MVWLFIQLLYTSCNKLPNLKSNVHLDGQTTTSYMDRDPYGSSIFPLSIAPWWELLKEKGLFDANDASHH
ncbi:hypothetical protein [Cardinium endosymbiont of Sogatella furcifera]|uniref:hypothetical protein n=1 Tax=Cardinium endosymbiont of Sogatella furcifera TaxID=650378 RepID=UPI0013B4231E|nr:hypothetical protein [Cardinium endosymbiont of Sogatella furcifera]